MRDARRDVLLRVLAGGGKGEREEVREWIILTLNSVALGSD